MSSSGEVPNHRACASCRNQKVRCIPDETKTDVCQRCARTNRPCISTPLQKRKQRKRTDTRVAELEREMRVMRDALKQKGLDAAGKSSRSNSPVETAEGHQSQPQGLWYKDQQPSAPALGHAAAWERVEDNQTLNVPRTGPGLWPWKFQNKPLDQNTQDVVDRGKISMATARHLFETYKTDLFLHYPLVVIPDSVTAEEMRKTKPALFLAIIAAAAGKENSELSAALDREVLQAYATRSLVQSEKSLELVQSLLISAVWYHPPTKFGQLKYYEYIHMAATMAMDIGIGSRASSRRVPPQSRGPDRAIGPNEDLRNPNLGVYIQLPAESPETDNIENRRTFLACYVICAGVSLALKRPNMLRVNSYIHESTHVLDSSPHALPSDAIIVAWVKLIIIAEEISVAFSYDDTGGIASIADLRTQLMLKDFEKRLTAWYTNEASDGNISTQSLLIKYYTVRLYLFEIALHVDHLPEDFRAPYQMGGIYPSPNADQIPTQILSEAISDLILSAHRLLDTFLATDVESARALPVFSYVRISFAAFILAKLCLSAAHPRSRIGKVLDRGSLKVERYMDRSILHVRNIVGEKKYRVPSIFLALMIKLRQWSLNPEVDDSAKSQEPDRWLTNYDGDAADRGQSVIELDDPPVAEPISSAESTPQTVDSDYKSPVENLSLFGTTLTVSNTNPAPSDFQNNNIGLTSQNPATNTSNQPSAIVNDNVQWPTQSMDMDSDLMAFFGDMNEFPEGGLTGLDDWATFPTNAPGVNVSNWQQTWAPQPGNNFQ